MHQQPRTSSTLRLTRRSEQLGQSSSRRKRGAHRGPAPRRLQAWAVALVGGGAQPQHQLEGNDDGHHGDLQGHRGPGSRRKEPPRISHRHRGGQRHGHLVPAALLLCIRPTTVWHTSETPRGSEGRQADDEVCAVSGNASGRSLKEGLGVDPPSRLGAMAGEVPQVQPGPDVAISRGPSTAAYPGVSQRAGVTRLICILRFGLVSSTVPPNQPLQGYQFPLDEGDWR